MSSCLVGCTNSATGSHRAICGRIAFVHPTRVSGYRRELLAEFRVKQKAQQMIDENGDTLRAAMFVAVA
jgi:hypothetical protein